MKTYPKMKNSGMEWIQDLPDHWNMKKLKFTTKFDLSTVDRHEDDEIKVSICHYPQVYKNEKISETTELSSGTCTKKEVKKFRLKKDDVLITKDSETADDIGVPAYVVDDFKNTVCGYHIAQLTTNKKELSGMFLFRFIQSDIVNAYFETESNGVTRFGLGKDSIGNLKIPIPSIIEQEYLSNFLDKKIQLIDKQIIKNQNLIESLIIFKKSLIFDIVTRGLTPCKMKKSQIQGVNEIPEHWNLMPLHLIVSLKPNSFVDGPFGSDLKVEDYKDSGIMIIQLQNIEDGKFNDKNQKFISEEKFEQLKKHIAEPGDIVFSKMADPIARACLVPNIKEKFIIVADCIRLRTRNEINNNFLVYSINSNYFRQKALSFSGGSTRQRIQLTQLRKFKIILPPFNEQNQISEFLDKQTFKIDDITSKTILQIEKLQEFRKSLISSAVTGKIDLRQEIVA